MDLMALNGIEWEMGYRKTIYKAFFGFRSISGAYNAYVFSCQHPEPRRLNPDYKKRGVCTPKMVKSTTIGTLWWTNIAMENHHFFMGKSTISMAIFNCYVSSPEGTPQS